MLVACGATPAAERPRPARVAPAFDDVPVAPLERQLGQLVADLQRCGEVDLSGFEGLYRSPDPGLAALQVEGNRVRFGVGASYRDGAPPYGRHEICPAEVLGRDDDELLARAVSHTLEDDEAHVTYVYLRREGDTLVLAIGDDREALRETTRSTRIDAPLPGLDFRPGALPELDALLPSHPLEREPGECPEGSSALEGEFALQLGESRLPEAPTPLLREVQRAAVARRFGVLRMTPRRLEGGGRVAMCLGDSRTVEGETLVRGRAGERGWTVRARQEGDRLIVHFVPDGGAAGPSRLVYRRTAERAFSLLHEEQEWFPLEILGLDAGVAVAHRGSLGPPLLTRDGGRTWAPFDPGVEGQLGDVIAHGGAWYATVGGAVLRSEDRGARFEPVAELSPEVGTFRVAVPGGEAIYHGLREAHLVSAGDASLWIVRAAEVLELSAGGLRTLWSLERGTFVMPWSPPYVRATPSPGGIWQAASDGRRIHLVELAFGASAFERVPDVPPDVAGFAWLGRDLVVVRRGGCEAMIRAHGTAEWTPFAPATPGQEATGVVASPTDPRGVIVACEEAVPGPPASSKILRLTPGVREVLFDFSSLGDRLDHRPPLGPPEVVGDEVWFPQLHATPTLSGVAIGADGAARIFTVPAPGR